MHTRTHAHTWQTCMHGHGACLQTDMHIFADLHLPCLSVLTLGAAVREDAHSLSQHLGVQGSGFRLQGSGFRRMPTASTDTHTESFESCLHYTALNGASSTGAGKDGAGGGGVTCTYCS